MSSTPAAARPASAPSTGGLWPVVLCWIAVALDGYDLVVLGAVIPTLEAERALGFTRSTLTLAATLGLVGVGIGAVLVGPLTDRYGRRRTLITCIAGFSVLTLAIAAAPSVAVFVVLRFLAGLGLGACLPTALAYMSEHAREGRASSAVTRVMTGYHVGAALTALLALVLVSRLGWESMFVVGGVAGLVVVPLMVWKLPESEAYLRSVAEAGGTPTAARSTAVVRPPYLVVSLGLWVASFMGLLLVYGLNTWLPTILGAAGYSIDAGVTFLLVLNVGAVIGLLVAGRLADARGNKPVVLVWFVAAALSLSLLAIRFDAAVVVYGAVLLAGVFVFSSQVLVYAFVGHLYPPAVRGTALGMAAGVGRGGAVAGPLVGGLVAYPGAVFAYASAAAVAFLALLLVPADPPVASSSEI